MEIKFISSSDKDPFRAVYVVFLILAFSISAEIILGGFIQDEPDPYVNSVARILLTFLTFYTIHRFSRSSLPAYKPGFKDLVTLCLVMIGGLFVVCGGRILSLSLASYFGDLHASTVAFAIPYAAGSILIQAVMGVQFGFVFTICLAMVLGIYSPDQLIIVPYVIATSMIACLSMVRYRARSSYLRAGISVSLIAIPFALTTQIINPAATSYEVVIALVAGLVGGILCSFAVAGTVPLLETLGGYVTDMTLIEIATLDHPLLKELSIQAPGTWNHSMVMGMMVESAADAIGANPILSRVGAYYHDIGKVKKPLYFVENQMRGENRHDKLSPSMSALIIRSHVKDGIEMAREHKIPKVIEDMIPQHHGTSLIEFFYNKALKEAEAEEDAVEVDETLYRYPGPKPQTKEAGILMLADGVEAAARTLSEPTPDRVQGLVQKMINKVFASGELNECELTLKDLHAIAKCFVRVLTGIHHQRVAYAEPAEKISEEKKNGDEKKSEEKRNEEKRDGEHLDKSAGRQSTKASKEAATKVDRALEQGAKQDVKKEDGEDEAKQADDSSADKKRTDKKHKDAESKSSKVSDGEYLKRLGIS